VFINGAGAKPEQVFTLGHALAHIWLGQSALSDVTPITAPEHHVERWCSQVAAELFVPLDDLRTDIGVAKNSAMRFHAWHGASR